MCATLVSIQICSVFSFESALKKPCCYSKEISCSLKVFIFKYDYYIKHCSLTLKKKHTKFTKMHKTMLSTISINNVSPPNLSPLKVILQTVKFIE